jgi:hypothetical protein
MQYIVAEKRQSGFYKAGTRSMKHYFLKDSAFTGTVSIYSLIAHASTLNKTYPMIFHFPAIHLPVLRIISDKPTSG